MKDWCTGFPDYWFRWGEGLRWEYVYIGDLCKRHDDDDDPRGGCDSTAFIEGLLERRVVGAIVIFMVSSVSCWVRYPLAMLRRL